MAEYLTVLVVGSGAREHVISQAYEKSSQVKRIVIPIDPSNAFIRFNRQKDVIIDTNCDVNDPYSILELAQKYKVDLADFASERPLAAGAVDLLESRGFLAFGPQKAAARIESSKIWSRSFQRWVGIPHPKFYYFDDQDKASKYVAAIYNEQLADKGTLPKSRFVKADGLCDGKGALAGRTLVETIRNIKKMRRFGKAGEKFLIEDGLEGEEFSYYAICDGENYLTFKSAQDNKRLLNFDHGAQTGGMGANSPALVTKGREAEIEEHFFKKAIVGLKREGSAYKGILYLGGMLNKKNQLACIEYNCRWGDPEAQVILPGIKNDYVELILAAIEGRLDQIRLEQDNLVRICVVGVGRGYPETKRSADVKGKQIFGLDEAMRVEGVAIYGAALAVQGGNFYAGGSRRLFSVVAEGKDILQAQDRAYLAIHKIKIEGNNLHFRDDIGRRDVARYLATVGVTP